MVICVIKLRVWYWVVDGWSHFTFIHLGKYLDENTIYFRFTMIYSMFTLGTPLKDKDI